MALIRRQAWQHVGGYSHIPDGWEDFRLLVQAHRRWMAWRALSATAGDLQRSLPTSMPASPHAPPPQGCEPPDPDATSLVLTSPLPTPDEHFRLPDRQRVVPGHFPYASPDQPTAPTQPGRAPGASGIRATRCSARGMAPLPRKWRSITRWVRAPTDGPRFGLPSSALTTSRAT